jgi:hypothetical protein
VDRGIDNRDVFCIYARVCTSILSCCRRCCRHFFDSLSSSLATDFYAYAHACIEGNGGIDDNAADDDILLSKTSRERIKIHNMKMMVMLAIFVDQLLICVYTYMRLGIVIKLLGWK